MIRKLTTLCGALLVVGALATPASAVAGPVIDPDVGHYPAEGVVAGGYVTYEVVVSNSGDAPTNAPVRVDLSLPPGFQVTEAGSENVDPDNDGSDAFAWVCSIALDSRSASCEGPDVSGPLAIPAGQEACLQAIGLTCRILITVRADSDLALGNVLTPTMEACGGGASCAISDDPTEVIPPFEFGIDSFEGGAFEQDGDPETRAGIHPHSASSTFMLDTHLFLDRERYANEDPKDAFVDLPPGLVGNPQAVDACSVAQMLAVRCPPDSQVGTTTVLQGGEQPRILKQPYPTRSPSPLYNIQPPDGTAALLAFNFANGGVIVFISAEVRTGGDYGIRVISLNAPQPLPVVGFGAEVWGVPADPSHDPERVCEGNRGCPSPDAADPKAFFTLPTSCDGLVRTDIFLTSWFGGSDSASFFTPEHTECDALDFDASLKAKPTTNVADSPSGLDVELNVPQSQNPDNLATAHLRDTTVTLPPGLVVNPSSANGLDACSSADIGLTSAPDVTPITYTPDAARCPDASKLGTVEVDTPLLDHTVRGAVYIARPYDNPFNSLLAIYIALDDPKTGVVVKIAGEVHPDPVTGQLTTTVENNPQLPFSDFRLRFFGGAGGSLRTPETCGDYATDYELSPWSGTPPVSSSDPWRIEQGPSGSCARTSAARPHAPSFDAGTISPIAKAYSPFVVNLRREDGSQQFSAVTIRPPQGLLAKLAGTATCPDSALAAAAAKTGNEERASPSCPAASEVGSVNAAAGAGPSPYHAPGKVYLSGPYKGAPLSFATIVPATAGPFDLGTVVTKIALQVNAKTSEVTAVSDPIPHILQGIPLDVRNIHVALDKPDFMLNPTSCDPMAVTGELTSTLGVIASLSSRFQLAECTRLGFKPKITLSLRGGTKRGAHPALTVKLEPRPGDANIASVSIAFPRSEFLENAHIRTICTRPAFAADQCPAGAIYGEATVHTPILDYPLSGPLYLRSSDNLLPDVVPDLRGPAYQPIRIESAARTDSIRGGIRNTVDFVPDAPFSRLLVRLRGAGKGLLVNSRDICRRAYRATVRYTAHNNLTYVDHPKMQANCKKAKKAKKGKRGKRAKRVSLARASAR